MKNLFFLLFLCPMLGMAQNAEPSLIFEIATIRVSPMNASSVERAMAAHNKAYHGSGDSGVRVYVVASGTSSGDYKWVMGPAPWSALDARPSDDAHNMDWQDNVGKHTLPGGNTEYIMFDPKLSRFPQDFTISKLFVRYIDVARGEMSKAKEILAKIHRVFTEKIPGETYGVYFNELPSSDNPRDISIVSFFDKYAWMADDNQFNAKYDEVFGKGSAELMWKEWRTVTVGSNSEIWEFREDLSGLSGQVKAMERQ